MISLLLVGLFFASVAGAIVIRSLDHNDWRTASRAPAGLAPDPATTREAIVQVYAARAFNWRGVLGVHTWISTKREAATHYEVHQVMGWRARYGGDAVDSGPGIPDRYWYGSAPELLAELRGAHAEKAIEDISAAISAYPYRDHYRLWPGPNSNTFTAWVLRRTPELRADLPPTAIGKDYLGDTAWAHAPSNTGLQLSIYGLAGLILALDEGIEVNLLGLTFGIDPFAPALKLPALGRIGAR